MVQKKNNNKNPTNLPLKYPNVRVAVIKNNCYKMLSCMIPERWFFGGFFGGGGGILNKYFSVVYMV